MQARLIVSGPQRTCIPCANVWSGTSGSRREARSVVRRTELFRTGHQFGFWRVRVAGRHAATATSAASAVTEQGQQQAVPLLTFSEAQDIAVARGLTLSVRELGPFYRITCQDGDDAGPIVGVSSGFTAAPIRLAHCDSLQVFVKRLSERGGQLPRDRGVGLGLLMCGAVIAYCRDEGCSKAEILAINDDDHTHVRLCKYYKRMGFVVVREVGANGLSDLPHQLMWGGAGTRMDADTQAFLARWSGPIRNRRA